MVQIIKYSVAAAMGFLIGWSSQHWFIGADQSEHFNDDKTAVSTNSTLNTVKELKPDISKNTPSNQPKEMAKKIASPDATINNKSNRSLPLLDNQINEVTSQRDYQANILYSSDDVANRLAAIEVLTDILASEDVAVGLGDIDVAVRIKSIEGLKIIASDNAIRYIGQSLFTVNTVETKLAAIKALSELSYHPYAVEFLENTSKNDSNINVRKAAVNALEGYSIEN
jgi:hypothetical protein